MLRRWFPFLVVLVGLLILLAPLVAFAGTGAAAPAGGDDLGDALHKLLVGTVTGVVALVGHRFWSWLGHHRATAKITQYAKEDDVLDRVADLAIDFAEELAHRAAKEGARMASDLKESAAVQHGLTVLEHYGVKIDTEKARRNAEEALRKRITARLGRRRAASKA